MKTFNSEHEVIINSYKKPVVENPIDGKDCLHYNRIHLIDIFIRIEENKFIKHSISRKMIVDLYNQIQEIEKEQFEETYYNFSF